MGQWHKLEFNIQTLTLAFRVRFRHTKGKKGTKTYKMKSEYGTCVE